MNVGLPDYTETTVCHVFPSNVNSCETIETYIAENGTFYVQS